MTSTNASSIGSYATTGATTTMGRRALPVIPPNFFGIAFGLAGLSELWVSATPIRVSAMLSDASWSLSRP